MERGCICVFAKPPRPGEVKARLAPEIGESGAAALAKAFFLDTWAALSAIAWAKVVLATTDITACEWDDLTGTAVWPQGPGTLGHRLERILRRALEAFPFAMAVGTDAPGLPVALLEAARDALRTANAVIGPSDDGGFYLLGLRRCSTDLLTGLPWSAPDTFCTLRRLRTRGLRTTVIPPWFDVDEPRDLDRLRALIVGGRLHAPETARLLASTFPTVIEAGGALIPERRDTRG
jgi:hypothetical protein